MLSQQHQQGSRRSFYDRKTVANPAYACQALVIAKETSSHSSMMPMQDPGATAVQETVCKLAQVPSLNNPCASFQLPRFFLLFAVCCLHKVLCSRSVYGRRGLYGGKTWDQRLQQRETKRQLVRTREFLEERAWENEDSVFADIAGRKRARCKDAAVLLSKARKVMLFVPCALLARLINKN